MDAARRSDPQPPGVANPGLAFLVCVAWYALVVVAFVGILNSQPETTAGDLALMALFVGVPTVFGAFIVSVIALGLLAAWSRVRSVVLLGTVASIPALVLLCALLCLGSRL